MVRFFVTVSILLTFTAFILIQDDCCFEQSLTHDSISFAEFDYGDSDSNSSAPIPKDCLICASCVGTMGVVPAIEMSVLPVNSMRVFLIYLPDHPPAPDLVELFKPPIA